MEVFRQWAVSLIIAGISGTVISLLSPRGSMEKTLRAVIGIFIVSAVVSPLSELAEKDSIFPAFANENIRVSTDDRLGEYILEMCEDTVGRVISETAEEHGIKKFGVDADMHTDEYNCIIIHRICITIPSSEAAKRHELSAELEKKLGVPVTVNSE